MSDAFFVMRSPKLIVVCFGFILLINWTEDRAKRSEK